MSRTRDRLIGAAHDLFCRSGFHAVGIDQILAEVGVTKTTFYNHFSSKDELVIEVLRWHDRWWRDTFLELLQRHGGESPRGQLLAVCDALDEVFSGCNYNGCIFVNVAVEYPQLHDPAHQEAMQHKRAIERILRLIAGYAGARDPQALAQELSLVMEGAYVTRHVTGDADTAKVARRLVTMLVECHLAGRAA